MVVAAAGGGLIAFIDGGQATGRMYRWQMIERESQVKIDQSRVDFQSSPYFISFERSPNRFPDSSTCGGGSGMQ